LKCSTHSESTVSRWWRPSSVEALASQGADHALTDCVGSGCPDRALYDPDAVGSKDGVEGSGELGVPISDDERDCACLFGELHREVASLLGHPAGDRLGGHTGDPHEARVVVDEHEDVEPAEENAVDMEEVARLSPFACAERNSAQVGPNRRGDGSMALRFRIAQTLDGAVSIPTVVSSPWMRR
jgi:hypothetical protein